MEIVYDNYEQDILDKDKEYSTDLATPIPIDDLIAFEHQLFDNMDFN